MTRTEALGGWNGVGPDQWLASRLQDTDEPPPWLHPLAELRSRLPSLAPTEALDAVIHLLDAATLCARWPVAHQRIGNLDAMRGLARRYEDRCARLREHATTAGLVRYFDETRQLVRIRDEEKATDDQFVGTGDDAVTVCTFHRAKGLEWPVVVLASLDRPDKRDAFDPTPETDQLHFDPDQPLAGRWIRYWPWPFGPQTTLPLAAAAERSPEGQRVTERERRERIRLLYVGFTRPRDHLVLAIRLTKSVPRMAWLGELTAGANAPPVTLPVSAEDGATDVVRIGAATFPCRVTRTTGKVSPIIPDERRSRVARGVPSEPPLPAYRITPSQVTTVVTPSYRIDRVRRTSGGIPLGTGTDWEALGNAVHGFLAADPYGVDVRLRLATARRILARLGCVGVLDPGALLAASDGLRAEVDRRWPSAIWSRETPVSAIVPSSLGQQRIEGVIDLLLEVPDGVIVIDHKTFPAPNDGAVRLRAAEFLPQLLAYAEALAHCGENVLSVCLHFPIAGAWVDVVRA